jgi:hypothetical protein
MVFGTLGFMAVEGLSLADAFYFSIVTIATVGYGDIHPATHVGKILAIILIIMGVGTFLGVVANSTEMMLNRRENKVRLQNLKKLPDSDLKHLSGDIQRSYNLLVDQWLDYMSYLKNNYPYLFSLAMRTNPFDEKASPVVE